MNEIWKTIPRFNGYYEASNLGNIRSLYYNGGLRKKPKNRILRHRKDDYVDINIFGKKYLVHILVWEAFNGVIPDGYECNHINQVRHDNRLDNLNLLTRKENINWGDGNLRRSKTILQYSLDGTFIKKWDSQLDIQRCLGISQTNISACCNGRRATSHGFIWHFDK